jgi:hypothetical protein
MQRHDTYTILWNSIVVKKVGMVEILWRSMAQRIGYTSPCLLSFSFFYFLGYWKGLMSKA